MTEGRASFKKEYPIRQARSRQDVTKFDTIGIGVNISGGEEIDSCALGFAVGDGGPPMGGSETILVNSIDYVTETIWSGKTLAVDENPDRYPQFAGRLPRYQRGTCPVWETIQPRIIMLKTNYFDTIEADRQVEIFAETIKRFD